MLGIIGVILVIICINIAQSKNRNPWLWGFLGIMLPIVSFIILLCLPTVTKWEDEKKFFPESEKKTTKDEKEEHDQAIRDMPWAENEENNHADDNAGIVAIIVCIIIFIILLMLALVGTSN